MFQQHDLLISFQHLIITTRRQNQTKGHKSLFNVTTGMHEIPQQKSALNRLAFTVVSKVIGLVYGGVFCIRII